MANDARFGLMDVLGLMACHPNLASSSAAECRADGKRMPASDGLRRGCAELPLLFERKRSSTTAAGAYAVEPDMEGARRGRRRH